MALGQRRKVAREKPTIVLATWSDGVFAVTGNGDKQEVTAHSRHRIFISAKSKLFPVKPYLYR